MPPRYPTPSRQRRRAAALIALGLLAVALAVAVGRLAGDAAAPRPHAVESGSRTVHAGAAVLTTPGGWRPAAAKTAGIAGLNPSQTAVLAPSPGLAARAVVTVMRADDASLVPAPLRRAVDGELPSPRRGQVAGRPAWLYSGLTLEGQRQMEVSVVPTSAGVVAVACIAPRFAWSGVEGCAQDVRSLDIARATYFTPSPGLLLPLRLPGIVAALDRARLDGRRDLRAARTRAGQSRAARALAHAYVAAADGVRPLPGADVLLARLRASARAYEDLGAAAMRGRARDYRAARREVIREEAVLARALRAAGS